MTVPVPVLLLTGTVGSGKTTLAYEVNDLLSEREVPNAIIDLDALTAQWPPSSRWNADLMFENLALLWPNYQAHGAERLVLAHVLEDGTERERYLAAVPGADLTVVRVVAPEAARLDRLRRRMPPGPSLDWHLHRTVELEQILAGAGLEDLVIDNGDRPIRAVAEELLDCVGW
jgi:adenylylsulfate kinase